MELANIRARWQRGLLTADQVPRLASELLTDENASGPLGLLATLGATATRDDIEPLLRHACADAGLPEITDEEAGWQVAYDTARQIVTGQVAPLEGARALWVLATDLGLPEPLRYFVYLAADYGEGPGSPEEEAAWFDAQILASARELLKDAEPEGGSPVGPGR